MEGRTALGTPWAGSNPVPSPPALSGSCSTHSASTWISSLPVRALCLLAFSFGFHFVVVFPLPSITISPFQLSLFLPSSSRPHLALGLTDNPAVPPPLHPPHQCPGAPWAAPAVVTKLHTQGWARPSSEGKFGWSRARICSRGSLSCSCFLLPRISHALVLPWVSPKVLLPRQGWNQAPSLQRRLHLEAACGNQPEH